MNYGEILWTLGIGISTKKWQLLLLLHSLPGSIASHLQQAAVVKANFGKIPGGKKKAEHIILYTL